MPHSEFYVSVSGTEISSTLAPILISMTITDADGGKNDTLEIELDDAGGSIALPPTNAPIQAGLYLVGDDGQDLGPPVMFEGKVDKPSSGFSRGGGLTLTISAKSADVKGKPKERKQKHHDKGKFADVAKSFGKEADLDVEVGSGIDVERDYWAMQGESYLEWGTRVAQDLGLTFKVRGGKAVFADRSSGQSVGGQALATIRAIWPENIISGQMSPVEDLHDWQAFRVRRYDTKAAKWVIEEAEAQSRDGGTVGHLHKFAEGDEASAKRRGKANSAEADRDRGGGTLTIDGDPTAQSEAPCTVSGVRPGIDGSYRIKTARHRLTRSQGYTTELTLVQPSGSAGSDTRESGSSTE